MKNKQVCIFLSVFFVRINSLFTKYKGIRMKKLLLFLSLISFVCIAQAMQKEKAVDEKAPKLIDMALESGDVDLLKKALADGVSPNLVINEKGWTLLIDSCAKGRADFVSVLLEKGADLNIHKQE